MSVTALGYVGIEARDLAGWSPFATGILGLAAEPASGALRLRMDERAYRIVIEPGERDDLAYLGWEVASAGELRALGDRLRAAGVHVWSADAATCRARERDLILVCDDPSGVRNEFSAGELPRAGTPFVSPRGLAGFVTGAGGVGHVVIAVDDAAATERFYCDLLGMRVSDYIAYEREPGALVRLTFLHCNARHHSLAFVQRPGAAQRISHLMIEARSLDDVGATHSLCERMGVPVATSLGRHTNDDMFSFYLTSPSGFNIEFGYGGKAVDDATWQIAHYAATSVWGHRRIHQREGMVR